MSYPFVVSVPHCAHRIPEEVRTRMALSPTQIMDAVDHGTTELFGALPAATVMSAKYSRLFCDLNRDPDDTGPKGIVAKTDYHGREIFKPGMYPDAQTLQRWLQIGYRPYHETLAKAVQRKDIIGLFDCHSLNGIGPADAPDAGKKRQDVILSNNGGPMGVQTPSFGQTSCPPVIMQIVKSAFEQFGFSVALNTPYKGGFITRHYGVQLLKKGGFAIQIEMNQDLYVDPQTGLCNSVLTDATASRIRSVFASIYRRFE
ncbi:N-formylglutamate amidohydrolase [Desulfatitalea alkaliphila]|uniref:N-formylglutamate amidohydrolase n=1 Tax=Desulfatitalea alkaliphila TaxID=2929485 RepID=A0AA41R5Z0_9BACT|nr:N-formylglutamate amidohydrolase [Desulfatitalea alkaliphila]MCJ8501491.1 N-formylglutamate amidohydrolase [Desulfatitalea alkaliphila]